MSEVAEIQLGCVRGGEGLPLRETATSVCNLSPGSFMLGWLRLGLPYKFNVHLSCLGGPQTGPQV